MQLETHGGKWKKEKKMKKSGRVKKTHTPPENPLDERGNPKEWKEDPRWALYETRDKSPGAMGGWKGIDFTPEQKKKRKNEKILRGESRRQQGQIKKKKGGGMIKYSDGGAVGNTASNFRGCF